MIELTKNPESYQIYEINESVTTKLTHKLAKLLALPKTDKTIVVMFTSEGGYISVIPQARFLIKAIQNKHDTIWVNSGLIASAACDIFLHCEHRAMLPESEFLIHTSRFEFGGKVTIENLKELIKHHRAKDQRENNALFRKLNLSKLLKSRFLNGEDLIFQREVDCKKIGFINTGIR